MDSIDEDISQELNSLHRREAARINSRRKELHALPAGRKVWYKRPEGSGNKLDSRWVGPCVVLLREGENSYKISTGPNSETISAPRAWLKEYNEDSTNEKPVPLFFHKRTVRLAREAAPRLRADRILGHRVDSDGNVSFLVKHVGGR